MRQFFTDDRMIWGNALLRAYKLEGQIAIYPRIIVEPEIAELIKVIMKREKKSNCYVKILMAYILLIHLEQIRRRQAYI